MGKRTDWRRLERRLLLFNLKSGDAIRGRLTFGQGEVITVEAVTLFDAENPSGIEVPGSVHLERADINFAQELPPEAALPAPADPTRQTG